MQLQRKHQLLLQRLRLPLRLLSGKRQFHSQLLLLLLLLMQLQRKHLLLRRLML